MLEELYGHISAHSHEIYVVQFGSSPLICDKNEQIVGKTSPRSSTHKPTNRMRKQLFYSGNFV